MGGAPAALPVVVEWRGIYTDPTTADMLDELARITGSIYVKPIAGCGSRQGQRVQLVDRDTGKPIRQLQLGSTDKSADTHVGDGAVDLDAEHLTDDEARELETYVRQLGGAGWFRPRTSPYTGNAYGWQRHVHLLRQGAALSPAAQSQVTAYRNKLDGLAVPHADRGTHAYLTRTWAQYLAQKGTEDTMTPQQLQTILAAINDVPRKTWAWRITNRRTKAAWSAQAYLEGGNILAGDAVTLVRQLAGKAGVDVDEQAIASSLAELIGPQLRGALVEQLASAGVDVDAVADAVLSRLGAALVDAPAA